jgi:hypothetical protein
MTREKFERACEIKETMDMITELEAVLNNSVKADYGERCLAAINPTRTNGAAIEVCKVISYVRVPGDILEKFKNILSEEYNKLDKEFEAL